MIKQLLFFLNTAYFSRRCEEFILILFTNNPYCHKEQMNE